MIDVSVPNIITIALISLVTLGVARWAKKMSGLPLPV